MEAEHLLKGQKSVMEMGGLQRGIYQTPVRYCDELLRTSGADATFCADRGSHKIGGWRTDILWATPSGKMGARVPDVEVPLNVRGC